MLQQKLAFEMVRTHIYTVLEFQKNTKGNETEKLNQNIEKRT